MARSRRLREIQARLDALVERDAWTAEERAEADRLLDEGEELLESEASAEVARSRAEKISALRAEDIATLRAATAAAVNRGRGWSDDSERSFVLGSGSGDRRLGEIIEAWRSGGSLDDYSGLVSRYGDNLAIHPSAFSFTAAQRVATGVGQIPSPTESTIAAFVRPESVLGWLGVVPQTVPVGEREFGWVRLSPNASNRAEDVNLAELGIDQMTVAVKRMTPVRTVSPRGLTLEASHSYQEIATAVANDGLAAVRDHLEAQVLNGDGTAPNFAGLFGSAASGRAAPAASVDTFSTALAGVLSLVDGRYAAGVGDLRAVMSPATYGWLSTLANGVGTPLTQVLAELGVGVRVSRHAQGVTVGSGTTTPGRTHHVLVRRGSHPSAVAWPMWEAVFVARQEIAGVGERLIVFAVSDFFGPGSDQSRGDFVTFNATETVDS